MPIETYDSADAVPEELRDTALALADGKFAVVKEEDVTNLKSALAKERASAAEAQRTAKALAAKAEEAELAAKGLLEHKQRWDSDILAPIKTEADQLRAEVRQLKLTTPVKDALRAAGVIAPDDAYRLISDQFDLSDDGKPILKDNPTADLKEWITGTLAKQKPYLFDAGGAGGGGARGSQGARTGAKVISRNDTKAFLANIKGIADGSVVVVD
jgi:hypothetical protein